ncbi:hypothetical protein [Kitasatospora purpeofusca]|uniref:hypothetical protein n=1 Tax=Kitasatospora purpeofusca TaxID=67352 RepID=UPI00055EED7A|nr:hypothetical protein [Kitasatospora purpeofusca]
MSDRGDDGDGDESGEVFLGGGPMVPGVDYEAAWLEARAVAIDLNTVLGALGLAGEDLIKAQAGWSDDGRGVVFLKGMPSGARRLRVILDGMAARGAADADGESREPAGSRSSRGCRGTAFRSAAGPFPRWLFSQVGGAVGRSGARPGPAVRPHARPGRHGQPAALCAALE